MAELESMIEQKLIDQLVYGDSQWVYRDDLKTEEDLWKNFRYILEQNNKDRLNGEPLSDAEFDQVKNQLQFSSFYKAGEWLVGENGKVIPIMEDGKRVKDSSIAEKLLPFCSGFFFGGAEYDEYYVSEIKETIDIITKALETTDFEKEMIYYISSW